MTVETNLNARDQQEIFTKSDENSFNMLEASNDMLSQRILDTTENDMHKSPLGLGESCPSEQSSSDSEDSTLSITNLLGTEEEKLNFVMMNHAIYQQEDLFKLCLACILSDSNLQLAINIISILPDLNTNNLLLSLIYLRLNFQQYRRQQQHNISGLTAMDVTTSSIPMSSKNNQIFANL